MSTNLYTSNSFDMRGLLVYSPEAKVEDWWNFAWDLMLPPPARYFSVWEDPTPEEEEALVRVLYNWEAASPAAGEPSTSPYPPMVRNMRADWLPRSLLTAYCDDEPYKGIKSEMQYTSWCNSERYLEFRSYQLAK